MVITNETKKQEADNALRCALPFEICFLPLFLEHYSAGQKAASVDASFIKWNISVLFSGRVSVCGAAATAVVVDMTRCVMILGLRK